MSNPALSVGLVVYRSDRGRLRATLESLARASALLRDRLGCGVRLFVIDNGAAESPLGEIPLDDAGKDCFDAVARIDTAVNIGFGRAHNEVLRRGCGDFHLVLNPDVEMDPGALLEGVQYLLEHPGVAGVVPHGRDEHGGALHLAKAEPTLLVLGLRALAPRIGARLFPRAFAAYELHEWCGGSRPVAVPIASGCFLLLRARCFEAVGGFSPDFFLYFEDFDLSRRIAACGPLVYLPGMRIVHHGGQAARKGIRHVALFGRSAFRYFSRWGWRAW